MLHLTPLTLLLCSFNIKYLLLHLNKIPYSILRATNTDPLKSILSGSDQQILMLIYLNITLPRSALAMSTFPIPFRSFGHLEQLSTNYRETLMRNIFCCYCWYFLLNYPGSPKQWTFKMLNIGDTDHSLPSASSLWFESCGMTKGWASFVVFHK